MATFSKKIFGLAVPALAFAGMAFGQTTCAAPTSQTNIIRAEGTTEQVAALTFTCTGTAAASAGVASVQVFLSPALPITSKVLSTSTGATEAVLTVTGGASPVSGTVSGSTLNFSGVPLAAGLASYTFTISNVRVNATSLSITSGVPPSISETVFVSGSSANINPAALAATQVAFAQNGLGTASLSKSFTFNTNGFPNGTTSNSGTNNFVICNAYSPKIDAASIFSGGAAGKSLAFVITVKENTATAFKSASATPGPGSEAPQVVNGSNAVVTGTRFTVNFNNVPANLTLYVPNGILTSVNGGAQAQLNSSAAGVAFAAVSGSTSSSITSGTGLSSGGANSLAAVNVSSGVGSATFEITTADPNNLDTFNIPVFAVSTSNTIAGTSTAITANVTLSPIGATTIPNFAIGSSTTTLTASTFSTCSTSLLFPFITNQLGFDTGIAIANTSTDPFGSAGATAQAGTCTMNFYGSGAPSPANVTTPNVPSGTVFTQVVSNVAAGFQGYMIAQCNFQFAHGFAFITDGVGVNGGLSQGYLAGVIPDTNQTSRGANPLSAAGSGTGETLGN